MYVTKCLFQSSNTKYKLETCLIEMYRNMPLLVTNPGDATCLVNIRRPSRGLWEALHVGHVRPHVRVCVGYIDTPASRGLHGKLGQEASVTSVYRMQDWARGRARGWTQHRSEEWFPIVEIFNCINNQSINQ